MSATSERPRGSGYPRYGLLAEFMLPEDAIRTARAAREAGYRQMDGYSPYPIEELSHALGHHRSRLPAITFAGGLAGGVGGFFFQWWASAVAYPFNIGGRPLFSWPAFVVPSFELTILFAAFATVLGMFALNNLPLPYHPVFNVPAFDRASRDRYFVVIQARDPRFDWEETRRFLEAQGPIAVHEVEG